VESRDHSKKRGEFRKAKRVGTLIFNNMNQKNIFSVIAAILVIQGIVFYLMGNKLMADVFPNLDESGNLAAAMLGQVMGAMSITIGLIAYAARNTPQVLWAYVIGFSVFSLVSLKHLLVDNINVPMFAIAIQIGIVLVCGYLWMQNKKVQST